MSSSRLASGGRIDRSRPLSVTFDGVALQAFAGDTLASALLASGITVTGTSVNRHRPRGIMTAGSAEPTGVVQIDAPLAEPTAPAPTVLAVDGLAASSHSGQGRLSAVADPAAYDTINHHCEVAVVGAGPAGLAAALTAARTGCRVLLLDDRSAAGGSLVTDAERRWADRAAALLADRPNVWHLQNTTVTGCYEQNYLVAVQDFSAAPDGTAPVRQRVWHIRAAEVVLACGAVERGLIFPGNDVPGVMLAESVREYLHRYAVLAGERVVLFTTHDDAYRVAGDLLASGAHVVIVDPRSSTGQSEPPDGSDLPTGTVLAGSVVIGTEVDARGVLSSVLVRTPDGAGRLLPADLLAVSGGWNPAVELFAQAGGTITFEKVAGSFRPGSEPAGVSVAGAGTGLRLTTQAVDDGERAGAAAAEAAVGAHDAAEHLYISADVPRLDPPDDDLESYPEPAAVLYVVDPISGGSGSGPDATTRSREFVDLARDVTVADLARATAAGLTSIEHVKRHTTAGTGYDQGRTSNLLTAAVTAQLLGVELADVGLPTFRAPAVPVAFAALAGRQRGLLFDPVRRSAVHTWHVAHGARFEDVGQWKRPWYYPRPGEDRDAAVLRECAAARTGVAFMDASTLGKIDVQGADAGAFLDLLYTNRMSSLRVGRIRYGVLCGLDGMVLDDGTVSRLGPNHFAVTTTTGNAARVLDWLEEWLQTEWRQLRVWCTSVTEQWATLALVGPDSRELLGRLTDADLSATAFAFMTFADMTVAGLPARVSRISFSGGLAFEISVAWSDAPALWDAVWEAGADAGLTPYGTETMHVLRAEKGYPVIGQDTDGTVTPQDLGLGWAIAADKPDYLGKRAHARPDNHRADRKQLVGLLPADADLLLPEGSQLVQDAELPPPPVPMLGHVTSAYRSAALGRTFALALLAGGRSRIGQQTFVVVDGVPRPVLVTSAVLVDPENARRDGDPVREWTGAAARADRHRHRLPVSPLAEYAGRFAALSQRPGAGVRIAEAPLTTQLNVRVRRSSPAADAVAAALGTQLPAGSGHVSYAGSDAVLGLGPDEFLVLAGPGRGPELVDRIGAALAATTGAVTDVSAARTMLRLSGRNVRSMLAHGLAIDLDQLPESSCAQSTLARCAVIVFSDGPPRTDGDLLKVLVRSSFAGHVADWLLLTAPEYL